MNSANSSSPTLPVRFYPQLVQSPQLNIIQPQAPKSPSGLVWNSMWPSFVAVYRFSTHLCKGSVAKSEVMPQDIIPSLLPDPTSIYTRCGGTKATFERLVVIVERQRIQMVTMLWLRQGDRALIWKIIGMWTDGPAWLIIHKYIINFQSINGT